MTKNVVITGATSGIGEAIARAYLDQGENVVLTGRRTDRLEALKSEFAETFPNQTVWTFQLDVTDMTMVKTVCSDILETIGQIDILVNNAGIRQDAMMIFMQNAQWRNVLDTSVNGFFFVTRRVLKDMLIKRDGRIVNIVSLSGLKGMPGQTNYSAAKAAVIGATKALAQEVAPRKVTVNAIAPGFIMTDMTKDLDEAELKKNIPLGRFGKPEEVASLVSFLTSDEAAYITGEVISINGGVF